MKASKFTEALVGVAGGLAGSNMKSHPPALDVTETAHSGMRDIGRRSVAIHQVVVFPVG